MVVIEIEKDDLNNLLGRKLSSEQIEEVLFLLKVETKFDGNKIECELSPDRPDMFSVEGIARAIKGYLEFELALPHYETFETKIILRKEKSEVRPFIACATVENVKLTDELIKSLIQMQEKLHSTQGRDRKKVAIGVHDLDKVKPPLVYKDVDEEKFVPLGESRTMTIKEILEQHPKGKAYKHLLQNKYPMIYDKEGIISFPPIINSDRTKITETTKNLFIDVTGTDEKTVNQVLNILVCNIAERSGKIGLVKVSNKMTPNLEPYESSITVAEINSLLGLELKENEISTILERMRFGVTKAKGGKINFLIPAFRADILHKVDVIEDIAIGYGYNNIQPVLPKIATIGGMSSLEKITSKLRDLMIGLGFQEVVGLILTNEENNFSKMNQKGKSVEILNPISNEYTTCRTWLLPTLMKILAANKHRDYPQKIFEIGDCIVIDENEETMTKTIRKLAGAISYDNANLTEIKSIVESVLKNNNINYKIAETNNATFISSRVGKILIDTKEIGLFGEINPEVLEKWDLERPVIAFELNIEDLM